jgi:hypothetical protein
MTNPDLKEAILEIVESQLRDNDPPETRQTLKRLEAAGYSRETAIEIIGTPVVGEVWQVMHEHKAFDPKRLKALLDELE